MTKEELFDEMPVFITTALLSSLLLVVGSFFLYDFVLLLLITVVWRLSVQAAKLGSTAAEPLHNNAECVNFIGLEAFPLLPLLLLQIAVIFVPGGSMQRCCWCGSSLSSTKPPAAACLVVEV